MSGIARRHPDGTWDSMVGGVTGGIQVGPLVGSIVEYQGSLLFSGDFLSAGGIPVNRIARWDGEAWSEFSSEFAGALFVHDGELYGLIVPVEGQPGQAGQWNPKTCPAPPAACSADVHHDNAVNIDELLQVISHWG